MKKLIFSFILLLGGFAGTFAAEPGHLVVSVIQVAGTTATEEYVEIYNPTSQTVYLKGFKLTKKTASGNEYTLVSDFGDQAILPSHYLLVVHPDAGMEGFLYTANNSIAVNNTVVLYGVGKQVVDKVGFGTASDFEGQAAPNPLKKQILKRKANIDTDNNYADFEILSDAVLESPVAAPLPPIAPVITEAPTNNTDFLIIINELYPDPLSTESESKDEWIELYNPNNFEVDLGGWILEDKIGVVRKYIIQAGTKISPNGYLVFMSADTKISLNNTGDMLVLKNLFAQEISSSPNYGKTKSGQGFANFDGEWAWTLKPTKAGQNQKNEPAGNEYQTLIKKTTTKKITSPAVKITSPAVKKTASSSAKTSKESVGAEKKGVLGAFAGNDEDVLDEKDSKKDNNLSIMFVLAAVVVISAYVVYQNRDEINEKIYN